MWSVSTMQEATTPIFNVYGMTRPSSNQESNPQILLVSAGSPLSSPFTISRGYWGPIRYQGPPSENWASKFFKEISAVYFDNAQLTLHPMVITFKTEKGEKRTKTYVGVTRETSHSAATTYSFVKKLVYLLLEFLPTLSIIHFVSDGPSNQ